MRAWQPPIPTRRLIPYPMFVVGTQLYGSRFLNQNRVHKKGTWYEPTGTIDEFHLLDVGVLAGFFLQGPQMHPVPSLRATGKLQIGIEHASGCESEALSEQNPPWSRRLHGFFTLAPKDLLFGILRPLIRTHYLGTGSRLRISVDAALSEGELRTRIVILSTS